MKRRDGDLARTRRRQVAMSLNAASTINVNGATSAVHSHKARPHNGAGSQSHALLSRLERENFELKRQNALLESEVEQLRQELSNVKKQCLAFERLYKSEQQRNLNINDMNDINVVNSNIPSIINTSQDSQYPQDSQDTREPHESPTLTNMAGLLQLCPNCHTNLHMPLADASGPNNVSLQPVETPLSLDRNGSSCSSSRRPQGSSHPLNAPGSTRYACFFKLIAV